MIQVPQLRPQFGAPPHHPQYVPNGQVPGAPPQPVQLPPQQKIIEKSGVRILCIADVRGNLYAPIPDVLHSVEDIDAVPL